MRLCALTLLISATLTLSVRADFNGAVSAYQQKDFASALNEFQRLAELGDAPSQRNLAAMYARGEQVGKDPVAAWAWAALAAEQEKIDAPVLRDAIAAKLSAEQTTQAATMLEALRAKYGAEAIADSLLPVAADRAADCTVSGSGPAVPVETKAPRYPTAALRAGLNAFTCLAFYLSPDGRPMRIRFTESALRGVEPASKQAKRTLAEFHEASLRAVKHWTFLLPVDDKLRETPSNYCMDYKISSAHSSAITAYNADDVRKRIATLAPLAEAGDGKAQYELAETYATELQPGSKMMEKIETTATELFLRSAINGDARGQYKLASKLLTGDQCQKDASKGMFWLTLAAQQGNAEAAWLLSQRLGKGKDTAPDQAKAFQWLKVAAESGHARAKLQYALVLLERDPSQLEQAAALLPELSEADDLAMLEAHARVAGLRGNFAQAVSLQEQVVAIANELQFAVTERQRALDAYRQQQMPTTGSLNASL